MTAKNRVDYIAIEEDAVLKFQFALIDAMNEAGLTKAELAKALGVSRARVSQLLDSEANPTLKVMARALHFLGYIAEYGAIERIAEAKKKQVEAKDKKLKSFLSVVQESEPAWAIREERPRVAANEDRLWNYVHAAQAA
ncbi:helix-turn-helix transcriptional regulator [Devosia sp.]|uniref:helix-turn-helix domain-containing protein n=1 Tax=Devosia sp. TaxID=1871048 RepID=UPI001ACC6839|nr:helix-turn-helix transcriptional regulator [Devosia sp.]MBN9335790.1 helix-turn-helix transcriptional regulator [Devosia sp.]